MTMAAPAIILSIVGTDFALGQLPWHIFRGAQLVFPLGILGFDTCWSHAHDLRDNRIVQTSFSERGPCRLVRAI